MNPAKLVTVTGVSRSELSRLTRFSRPTVQRRLDEGASLRRHTDEVFFSGIMDAIDKCRKDNVLPLPSGLSSAERDRRLKALVQERFTLKDIQFLIA